MTYKFSPDSPTYKYLSIFTNRRCFNNQKLFEPFWSSSEDFEEILISSLMWADHMPDYVLHVLKDTFQRLHSSDQKRSHSSPPCRQHQRGLQRCPSDNASCYISVLDSPTGKKNNILHAACSLITYTQMTIFSQED